EQRLHRINVYAAYNRRLVRVRFRHDQVGDLLASCRNRDGQGAADATHAAIKRELTHHDVVGNFLLVQCTVGAQDAERHWQVEAGAFFLDVSGREVDGDMGGWDVISAVAQGGADALAAFAHRGVGKPDGVEVVLLHLDA